MTRPADPAVARRQRAEKLVEVATGGGNALFFHCNLEKKWTIDALCDFAEAEVAAAVRAEQEQALAALIAFDADHKRQAAEGEQSEGAAKYDYAYGHAMADAIEVLRQRQAGE